MDCLIQTNPQDDPVYQIMNKKRDEGRPYLVYMTARANKLLHIYYGRMKEYLATLEYSPVPDLGGNLGLAAYFFRSALQWQPFCCVLFYHLVFFAFLQMYSWLLLQPITIKCNILPKQYIALYKSLLYFLASPILVQSAGRFDACVARPMPPFNVPIISSEEIPPIFILAISLPTEDRASIYLVLQASLENTNEFPITSSIFRTKAEVLARENTLIVARPKVRKRFSVEDFSDV